MWIFPLMGVDDTCNCGLQRTSNNIQSVAFGNEEDRDDKPGLYDSPSVMKSVASNLQGLCWSKAFVSTSQF